MRNLKMQLEVLEAIDSAPTPLARIPATFIHEDDTVTIPGTVMKYMEEQGETVELDKNERIEVGKYSRLLDKHHLGINQIRFITFKDEPEAENVILDY